MANSSSSSSSGGIGVFGLLGVVFVTLKLCKVIDWSWWWVTCPFWGGLAIILTILLIVFICAFVTYVAKAVVNKNRVKINTQRAQQDLLRKRNFEPRKGSPIIDI